MTRERNDGQSQRRNVAPIWKGVAALVGALFVAIATAIGTGLGSGITHQLEGAPKLLSYSAKPAIAQCGTQLFIPGRRGSTGHLAVSPDWASVMRDNGGGIASPSVTTVSIQGETSRPVTLTDIKFTVTRHRRPKGGIYGNPCGDSVQGRFVAADLDRTPVQVIASSRDPSGAVYGAQSANKPIRFPWTVSLTDPLLLNVVAITRRCYCVWRADISWQSGGKSGVLRIDDGGHGYAVVGPVGIPGFLAGNNRWDPFKWTAVPAGGGGD